MGVANAGRGIGGFALTVLTQRGKEIYQVFLEETSAGWVARIVTLPNQIWAVPGGREAVKFHGSTASEAESAAAAFIEQERIASGRRLWIPRPGVRDQAKPGGPILVTHPKVADRIARRFLVRFGLAKPDRPGVTGNLSETGLFIITNMPGQVGSELEIDLRLPDAPLVLGGEVVWIRTERRQGASVGCGVRLIRRPPEYLKRVRDLSMPTASWSGK